MMNTGTPESDYGAWYPGLENDGAAGGGFEPSPYGQTWLEQPHADIAGRTIIVIDDIFDEGTTLRAVAEHCRQGGAAQVFTAVMLVKDRQRNPDIPLPDYVTGLTVPDRYVFGCGMDLYGRWRHLTAVYALTGNTGRQGS